MNIEIFQQFPIIAGGLLSSKKEVITALSAGAICVSATREEVWKL